MPKMLNDQERTLLEVFAKLEKEDPQGAWNSYYHEVVKAAGGDLTTADVMCRNLRRRKLLSGEGRGKHASYWPSDDGKAALGAAS